MYTVGSVGPKLRKISLIFYSNCYPQTILKKNSFHKIKKETLIQIIFGAALSRVSIGNVFKAKMPATVTRACHYCTCLGHLGWCNTDRTISICIASPKVAKVSKGGNIGSRYHWHFCVQTSPMYTRLSGTGNSPVLLDMWVGCHGYICLWRMVRPGNTKRGSIIVPLTSGFTGLD
jgi:hypothetical protein